MRIRSLLTLTAVSAALVAGCGDDEEETTTAGSAPAATATAEATPDNTDTSVKPTVTSPGGAPPAELESTDIVEGEGKRAKAGDTVKVQYVGTSYSTGEQFDASWDRGEPFEFELGAGNVIPGWDQGVEGMRVGGRRQLVIPPDLAYGAAGAPPAIGPNETLIFVIDLLEVD